jgi:hypothetical protein
MLRRVGNAFRALFSWRALEAVGVAASAVAAGWLTHVELTKHDYERNKTSFDVLWRLDERTQQSRNASACARFVNAKVTSDNQWEQFRKAEPIDVEALGSYERELLDRCVSDGKGQSGGIQGKDPANEASNQARMTIRTWDVLEIRRQVLGTLDAYDFALIPYKTEIGNRALICENLIGIFWHGSKDGAPRPSSQTKMLVDNVFAHIPEAEYSFPNLYFFLHDVDAGKCKPKQTSPSLSQSTVAELRWSVDRLNAFITWLRGQLMRQ